MLDFGSVKDPREIVYERVYENRSKLYEGTRHLSPMKTSTRSTHVFDNENRPPLYLRAQILHRELALFRSRVKSNLGQLQAVIECFLVPLL